MLARLLEYLPFALPFYLMRLKIGPLPTTILELYLGLIFVTFLYERGQEGIREGWKNLGRFRPPVIAWLIVTLIAVFVSPSLWTAFGLWRAYVLEPVLIFFILHSLDSQFSIPDSLRRNLLLVTIFLTLWALIQFVTGYGIPHPWNVAIDAGRRATGPFPYPNALALFVVPVGAYALSRITHHASRITQRIAIATILAAFLSVLLAKSDGGLIALSAVTWLALLLFPRTFHVSRFTFHVRPWLLAATFLSLLLTALIPAIHKPLLHELTFQGWSGKVRLYMWRDSYAMLKDHWLFGAGLGGYPTVFKPYQRTTGIEVFQYPHNILLNFWSETGFFGLLAFAWILFTTFRSMMRDACYVMRILPFLALLIHGLVDVPYFKNDLALLFWILIWLTTVQIQKPTSDHANL